MPGMQGKVPRIVKPRSAAQRAHQEHYKRNVAPYVAPPPSMPTTSWWLDLDRDTFSKSVTQERNRIKHSRFGHRAGPGTSWE